MNSGKPIGVIGSGSWGTAIVKMLLSNEKQVNWWIRKEESIQHINEHHRNPNYLPYAELYPAQLNMTTSIKEVIEQSGMIIFAIPAAFLHQSLLDAGITSLKGHTVVSAIKGIVPETNQVISEYFTNKFEVDHEDIGIISGPCHSEEVAMEKLSYLTIAFHDVSKAEILRKKLNNWYMRITVSDDIQGTEYAAILKNVVALANGICVGIGYGDNFQAVLISNAIQEMGRFLDVSSPKHRNITHSAYLGDTLVTAYSKFSRNRMFGTYIGKGYSVKSTMAEMKMVAEGYWAVKSLKLIKDNLEVEMPVVEAVYQILHGNSSPFVEMRQLAEQLS